MASSNGMSRRERLWTVLNGGEPDRIPWCPCVSPYYLHAHPKAPNITEVEAYREMDADILVRITGQVVRGHVESPEISYSVEQLDGKDHIEMTTPVGTLRSIQARTPTSPWLPFPIERPVKNLEDFKVLMWALEHRVWQPTADYSNFDALVADVGDEGYVTIQAPSSPLQALLEIHMGVVTFYEMLFTYTDEVEAWMSLCHEQQLREMELMAESKAEVIIGYENTSMSSLSPDLYRKYIKGRLDDYADVVRSAGKVYLNHDCGLLKGVEDAIRDGHQNGRIDVAREPTGNFDYARRLELTGDKVMIGGIDATAFTTLSPDAMKEHAREFLREVAPGRYFALGSGDAIPMHTPPEVLKAVGEVVAEEGAYPLSL